MAPTISETPGRKKSYVAHLGVPVTHLEQMLVDYYAVRYSKARAEVVRGMMRKYIELDENFDTADFASWAEKNYVAGQADKETKKVCRQALAKFVARNTKE